MRRLVLRLTELTARIARKIQLDSKLAHVISLKDDAFYVLDDNPNAQAPFLTSAFTFVDGLQFRALSAMISHRESIRDYFEPIHDHQEKVDEVIRQAREKCDVLIGVHIRGGDYATHLGGRYLFCNDDYRNLMFRIKGLFPDRKPGFLLCSNTPLQHETFEGLNHHFGPSYFLQDMYSLAKCDYIIGPPSTYSLWAAYYGGVPLFFVQDPNEQVSLEKFRDYFGIVGSHKVHRTDQGEQFVEINGAKYGLVFPTDKEYLAL
jgi:hypothetical protein